MINETIDPVVVALEHKAPFVRPRESVKVSVVDCTVYPPLKASLESIPISIASAIKLSMILTCLFPRYSKSATARLSLLVLRIHWGPAMRTVLF